MKKRRFFAICIVLLAAVFTGSCHVHDPQPSSVKSFSYDLRGTRTSNKTSLYSGKLIIDFDTIARDLSE